MKREEALRACPGALRESRGSAREQGLDVRVEPTCLGLIHVRSGVGRGGSNPLGVGGGGGVAEMILNPLGESGVCRGQNMPLRLYAVEALSRSAGAGTLDTLEIIGDFAQSRIVPDIA